MCTTATMLFSKLCEPFSQTKSHRNRLLFRMEASPPGVPWGLNWVPVIIINDLTSPFSSGLFKYMDTSTAFERVHLSCYSWFWSFRFLLLTNTNLRFSSIKGNYTKIWKLAGFYGITINLLLWPYVTRWFMWHYKTAVAWNGRSHIVET